MTTTMVDHAEEHEAHGVEIPYVERVRQNRMGLWLFFFSELFLFGGMLMARFYLWRDPATGAVVRPGLNQYLGLATTSVLLLSSVSMAIAEAAISRGERKTFLRGLLTTAALGTLFLVGVVGLEWNAELRPGDGAFGAIFFGMTGLHAFHVLTGVFLILIVWWRGRQDEHYYTPERHWGVEATAIYWHYVDVVWVFFYPALYLIGEAVHLA